MHRCVDCRSALAEAEVEYYDKTSPSIDVAFQAVDQDALKTKFGVSNVNGPISLVIWTTTPWTLPANRAISIAPDFDYALVQIDGQAVILAKDLVESVMQRIGVSDYTILGTVKGAELELLRFTHPFMDFDVPAILGDHVTLDAGTGAVHTAPGHGPDDYVIGQKYGLETANPVGPDGTYLLGTYPTLDGVNVFKANDIVIALLQEKGALLHVEKMQHSYPCCWRHKTPIIFRATPQWFVSMDQKGLRAQSLKEIKGVQWIPDWGQARIESMVHGPDDYVIGQKYGLETANPVGPDGTYLPGTYPTLDGVNVFKANDLVIALLQEKGALLHVEKMQHSYPSCWRHKTPIIFRATPQWFVSMDQKGQRAQSLKEIKGVQWIPDWGQARIESMVANSPDWCISRQSSWGVPMSLFVHKDTE